MWIYTAELFIVTVERMITQNRSLLHLLFIISTFVQVRCGLTEENVNRTVYGWQVPLCPLTAFCDEVSSSISCGKSFLDTHLACRCDPQCLFYNDCCLDYALSCSSKGTLHLPSAEAVSGISPNQVTCLQTPGAPSFGYYQFVNRCPNSWTRDDVRSECERDTDLKSPRQFIPVDFLGEITFKNVYCAICNGKDIQDLTPWVFETKCDTEQHSVENSTMEEQIQFLMGQCYGWFLKPSEEENSARSCIVTSSVNPCQNVANKSPEGSLSDACLLYQAEIKVQNVTYRNPHCFQCFSQGSDTHRNNESVLQGLPCPQEIEPFPGIIFVGDGDLIPISLLLDFSKSPQILCEDYQIFDAETLTCLNLTCPEGYILDEQLSCIRTDTIDQDCLNENTFPVVINVRCRERLPMNSQCLPSLMLSDELQSTLGDVLNLTKELVIDRIQVMNPNVDGNNTKCTQEVSVSGYLQGDFFAELDQFFSTSRPLDISLSSFSCQVSSFRVAYGCFSEIDSCPNQVLILNPEHRFDDTSRRIYFENSEFSLYNSTYYLIHLLDISTNSYTKEEYIHICNFTNVLQCPLLTLNASLFEERHDGSLIYLIKNVSFLPGEFTKIGNHSVQVCNFIDPFSKFLNYSQTQAVISTLGSCLSIIALLLTIATYSRFKSLRRTTFNVLIKSLSVSLILAHTLLLLSGVSSMMADACIAVAVLGHYMWLVVFSHTSALAVNLHRRFGVTVKVGQVNESTVHLLYFLVFAWMCPLLVVVPCTCLFFMGFVDPNFQLSYGQAECWIADGLANLYVFGIPVAFFLLINLIIFASIVVGIRTKTMSKSKRRSMNVSQQFNDLWIYVKVSTLLGFTWIFGFIAAFTDVTALWYVFIVLNSLQGVYIFIAFICKKNVFKLWRDSCSCLQVSRSCCNLCPCSNDKETSSRSTTLISAPQKEAVDETNSTV